MDNPKISYYPRNNLILSEVWKDSDSLKHRLDGPALIHYGLNSKVLHEQWYIHGTVCRIDKPAMITYYENGDIRSEYWYSNGQKNRLDGPAVIDYDGGGGFHEVGSILYEEWWIGDKLVDPVYIAWPLTNEQQVEFKLKRG